MEEVLKVLRSAKFYGSSEYIEIAKGKNEMPTTIKKGINQIKREYKWLMLKK